jgi:hypothetical protein
MLSELMEVLSGTLYCIPGSWVMKTRISLLFICLFVCLDDETFDLYLFSVVEIVDM